MLKITSKANNLVRTCEKMVHIPHHQNPRARKHLPNKIGRQSFHMDTARAPQTQVHTTNPGN